MHINIPTLFPPRTFVDRINKSSAERKRSTRKSNMPSITEEADEKAEVERPCLVFRTESVLRQARMHAQILHAASLVHSRYE